MLLNVEITVLHSGLPRHASVIRFTIYSEELIHNCACAHL